MTRARGIAHVSILASALLAGAGCSVSTRPIAEPPPSVTGSVQRDAAPAVDLHVELRTLDGRLMASTHTSDSGAYGIQVDASGAWEIKAVGSRPGDFDSVIFDFQFRAAHPQALPPLDVSAYGAQAGLPADSAAAPAPNPIQPLTFTWTMPGRPGSLARVQCFDANGNPVWYSNWVDTTQVLWNGIENQGASQGRIVTPGTYHWRLKYSFPDSSNGHTPPRSLALQ